jgi:bifunctional DNA-binding transcriptional regulator/antitoxin component of YhaV-PrlF toxin-antitoxin module
MEPTIHIHLGKDRRIAIPAQFCKEANLHPGDSFLLSRQGNQLVLTPLEDEAERMRRELRDMLGPDTNLMDDLRTMRAADADDEARRR